MKIKTLVLDADNVVLKKISPVIIQWLTEASNKTIDEVKVVRKKYWNLTKIGEITEEENWLGVKDKEGFELGVFGELSISSEKYSEFIEKIKSFYQLYEGCLDFLNQLKAMNLNLYLFSNSSYVTIENAYEMFKLKNYFKGAFFSHKIKVAKPSKRAFDILINKTSLLPENTLFIDDKENNLNVAKELGFNTYLFKNKDDFEKILMILNDKNNE